MKKLTLVSFAAMALQFSAYAQHGAPGGGNNPFFTKSTLPFEAIPFDKIKDGDYQPAVEEGIRQQQAEIDKIANSSAAPTFENTLVAMEKSGELLTRVNHAFNVMSGANTNPVLQKVQEN